MTRRLLAMPGALLAFALSAGTARADDAPPRFLDGRLLVTWYGNPHTGAMGVLGEKTGAARAEALRRQAAAYEPLTSKKVVAAYHLVAVVAQRTAGGDGKWRRRESAAVIRALLDEARAEGFLLVLDVQPGRSPVLDELEYLRPFLAEPDVHLALDPEFAMDAGQEPGRKRGHMHAADVNAAIAFLEELVETGSLPAKVLVVHQFTLGMLPDKAAIRDSPSVDVVLDMDGFGPRPLKKATHSAITRQGTLEFAGVKLFYRKDQDLLAPADVMSLVPIPAVVVYQ
jgi:hypothetical protein